MLEENSCSYRQFCSHDALAPYIECFWMLKSPSHLSTGSERLPADGRVEVMFHLAGPSKRYQADGQGEPHVQRTSSILGGRSRGYVVEQIGASHYVAIRFRPGGIAPFIHLPLTDLVDQVVDLDVIWGPTVKRLEEQLFEAPSPQALVEILNTMLLGRFEHLPHLRMIEAATQLIDASGGNLSVRHLADHFGWSQKHFERLFAQYIGFHPKRYARISRFQQMSVWAASRASGMTMGELAAAFGYFDQSHFSKEVMAFTGASPRTFFSSLNRIVENIYGESLLADPSV